MLLVMVALPAVLCQLERHAEVVSDAGAGGRGVGDETQGAVVDDGGVAGRAVVAERQRVRVGDWALPAVLFCLKLKTPIIGEGGVGGRAVVVEISGRCVMVMVARRPCCFAPQAAAPVMVALAAVLVPLKPAKPVMVASAAVAVS